MGYEIDTINPQYYQLDDLLSGYRVGAVPRYAPAPRAPFHPAAAPHFNPALAHAAQLAQARGFYGPQMVGQTPLVQTAPTKDGQLVLPMSSSGAIAAATSATITARPQIAAYRPERIVIANSIASNFTLNDIKVGNTSQFVQAGSIPAEAFIQGAFGVEMRMDTVQTAMDFVFQVTNTDATTPHSFLSVVFGRSVY